MNLNPRAYSGVWRLMSLTRLRLAARIVLLTGILPFVLSAFYSCMVLSGRDMLSLQRIAHSSTTTTASNNNQHIILGTTWFVHARSCAHKNDACFVQLTDQLETVPGLYDYQSIAKSLLNAPPMNQASSVIVYQVDHVQCLKFQGSKYCKPENITTGIHRTQHVLGTYGIVDEASTAEIRLGRPHKLIQWMESATEFFRFSTAARSQGTSSQFGVRRNPIKADTAMSSQPDLSAYLRQTEEPAHLWLIPSRPAMLLLLTLQLGLAFWYWNHNVSPSFVAQEYKPICELGHAWRLLSGATAHFDIWHVGLNMAALYNLSVDLEGGDGKNTTLYSSPEYLGINLSLVALVGAVWLLLQRNLLSPEKRGPTVGYSGVLFALSVISTLHQPTGVQTCPIPFLEQACFSNMKLAGVVPFSWSPLIQLVVAQVLLPRVSWTGHLAGVIVGYAYMWGMIPLLAFPSFYWPLLHMGFLLLIRKIETKSRHVPYKSVWFVGTTVLVLLSMLVTGGTFEAMFVSFALWFVFDCYVEASDRHESVMRGFIVATLLNLLALSITIGCRVASIGLWTDAMVDFVQALQWLCCLAGLLRHSPDNFVTGIFGSVLGPLLFPWTDLPLCRGGDSMTDDTLSLPMSVAAPPQGQQSASTRAFQGAGHRLGGGSTMRNSQLPQRFVSNNMAMITVALVATQASTSFCVIGFSFNKLSTRGGKLMTGHTSARGRRLSPALCSVNGKTNGKDAREDSYGDDIDSPSPAVQYEEWLLNQDGEGKGEKGKATENSEDEGSSSCPMLIVEDDDYDGEESFAGFPSNQRARAKRLDLMWCNSEYCKDTIRERVDAGGHIVLTGPATGQVAYEWKHQIPPNECNSNAKTETYDEEMASVLLLIKPNDEELLQIAAEAVREWVDPKPQRGFTSKNGNNSTTTVPPIQVLLDPPVAARLEHYYNVPPEHLRLFEGNTPDPNKKKRKSDSNDSVFPDLICALGGDGLLMHAGMLFQGPSPPIISIAGGSLGFLTPFDVTEMVDAVRVALGIVTATEQTANADANPEMFGNAYQYPGNTFANSFMTSESAGVYPPNMISYPYEPLRGTAFTSQRQTAFGADHDPRMCLSIRMRLSCRILNRQGVCRANYNVLNEVVIDRGSSPYLAALECFCDHHHMTTVKADGIIFATPTGSTAYSMAAGGSVVHPAVPAILVTPICPHVLSFRSMIFPDHVVLQCVVPDDARAEASVAFDGKHRQPLHRGDSIIIQMSKYPIPTLNRLDHSNDWLSGLKTHFGFNARPRQRPLNDKNTSNNFGPRRPMPGKTNTNEHNSGATYDDHSW
mmetsp:Transcript_28965/g.79457  ORF Transcript_28965/g.79457 Transcript_28965/m.79457 type:complete len:1311 (-) Transcript_28965:1489-5421(-)